MKLYITKTSGNAWKVRLLLSMLKQPFETIVLDSDKKENKTPEFLKLNPRGQVPVLVDGDQVFWDSTACLVYLARKYGGEQWLPTDPAGVYSLQISPKQATGQRVIHLDQYSGKVLADVEQRLLK